MIENITNYFSPTIQAFLAGLFTWSMTALGACLVLFFKNVNRKLLDTSFGFAAEVMIAASFWSLLEPAIEMSQKFNIPSWIPPAVGFLSGTLFLRLIDLVLPHLHFQAPISEAEGIKTSFKRSTLLVFALTLNNIPEGLAISMPLRSEGLSKKKSFMIG